MQTMNDIARHTNISPAYLSSLFKKVSGQSISDTITSLRIESACHYLESTNLSLKEISMKCGYANQYYFSKKVSGQSISDTITSLRIESACHYLESTNLSLKEISMKCGYANQYYFSNSFKKKLGMSPSVYRETKGTQTT